MTSWKHDVTIELPSGRMKRFSVFQPNLFLYMCSARPAFNVHFIFGRNWIYLGSLRPNMHFCSKRFTPKCRRSPRKSGKNTCAKFQLSRKYKIATTCTSVRNFEWIYFPVPLFDLLPGKFCFCEKIFTMIPFYGKQKVSIVRWIIPQKT
jgi:hypothetical protein